MAAKITWKGDELIKAIDGVTDEAVKSSAEIVAKKAKRLVPVQTGALRDSIKIHKSKFAKSKITGRGGGYIVQAQGPGDYDKFYALFVELGLKKTRQMKAQPFLRPALKLSKRDILKQFENKL